MMTREEASVLLKMMFAFWANTHERTNVEMEMALNLALAALRPVSREQVEKVWRGEWKMVSNGSGVCSECHRQDKIDPLAKFCRYCGAPMTDEAVQIVMDRLEALHEDNSCS